MKTITIGEKPLKEFTAENILSIARIEGVHLAFEYWRYLKVLRFRNDLFSDTYVIEFYQERIDDGFVGKTIVFFFCFSDFSFHWHFDNEESDMRQSKRIGFESMRYLIKEGFDLPLY